MTAPVWMNAVIGDFGRAAGLNGLALNERGAAALKFADGTALRLEYADGTLVVAMTVPSADVRRLLSLSHPNARYPFNFTPLYMLLATDGLDGFSQSLKARKRDHGAVMK